MTYLYFLDFTYGNSLIDIRADIKKKLINYKILYPKKIGLTFR